MRAKIHPQILSSETLGTEEETNLELNREKSKKPCERYKRDTLKAEHKATYYGIRHGFQDVFLPRSSHREL